MRETVETKARRLLISGHVRVEYATDTEVIARVQGDNGVYGVRWSRWESWHCDCACWGRCSHIEATARVTTKPTLRIVAGGAS